MEQVSYALDQGRAVVLEKEVPGEGVLLGVVAEQVAEQAEVLLEMGWEFWLVVFQPCWFELWSELPSSSEGSG